MNIFFSKKYPFTLMFALLATGYTSAMQNTTDYLTPNKDYKDYLAKSIVYIINNLAENLDGINACNKLASYINTANNKLKNKISISPEESYDNIKLIVKSLTKLNKKLNNNWLTDGDIFRFLAIIHTNDVNIELRRLEEKLNFIFQPLFDNYQDYLEKSSDEVDEVYNPKLDQVRDLFMQKKQLSDLLLMQDIKKPAYIYKDVYKPHIDVLEEDKWDKDLSQEQEQNLLNIKTIEKKALADNALKKQEEEKKRLPVNLNARYTQDYLYDKQLLKQWTKLTEAQRVMYIIEKLTENLDVLSKSEHPNFKHYKYMTNLIEARNNELKIIRQISPKEPYNNIKLIYSKLVILNEKLNSMLIDDDTDDFLLVIKVLQSLDKRLSIIFQSLFDNYQDYLKEPNLETDTPESNQAKELYIQKQRLSDLVSKFI